MLATGRISATVSLSLGARGSDDCRREGFGWDSYFSARPSGEPLRRPVRGRPKRPSASSSTPSGGGYVKYTIEHGAVAYETEQAGTGDADTG